MNTEADTDKHVLFPDFQMYNSNKTAMTKLETSELS